MRWAVDPGTARSGKMAGMEQPEHDAARDDAREAAHGPAGDAAHPRHDQARTHRHDVEVRVRRAPKYGRFMAIGAVLGAVVAWLISVLQEPGVDEAGRPVDTTPVIGLIIVIGFVVGVAAGGLVALLVDRAARKRAQTLVAEQTDVEPAAAAPGAAGVDAADQRRDDPADAGEAAFEPLGPADAVPYAPGEAAVGVPGDREQGGSARHPESDDDAVPGDAAGPDGAAGPGERDRPAGV